MKAKITIVKAGLIFLGLTATLGVLLLQPGERKAPGPAISLASEQSNIKSSPVIQSVTRTESPTPNRSGVFRTAESRWSEPIREIAFAQFHDWAEQYLGANASSAKASLEPTGVQLARQRRLELVSLIQSDPERALEMTVPVRVRQSLPSSVVGLLEQPVSGHGSLLVFNALPEPGKESEVTPVFRTANVGGKEYKAFVYGRRLGEPTRNDIPLNGIALDGLMAVNVNPVRVLEPAESASLSGQAQDAICGVSGLSATINNQATAVDVGGEVVFTCQANHAEILNDNLAAAESGGPTGGANPLDVEPSVWTEGPKSLIVIRVDFSDLAGAPFPDSTGTNMVNGLASFYSSMSYGKTSFKLLGAGSEMTPTFRMPQAAAWYGTNNNYTQLRSDARNAATSAGYTLGSFDRDLICFGSVPGWGWAGLGYVGAAGVWLRSAFSAGVAGHELGHNAGLNHANFWDTAGASIIGPGSNIEYGDPFDTMGSAGAGIYHFNVRNKAYLNWLTTNDWVNVTSNGTYRIACHDDTNSVGFRALRVVKNPSTNYWVEFRQKWTSNKWLMNGAGLRMAQNGNIQSLLLDTTPGSISTKNDSAIVIGRTFADPDSSIYITPIGFGNTTPQSLDVTINVGSFPGNHAPTVTLAASATNAAVAASLTFTVTASDSDGDSLAYYWDFGDDSFGTNGPAAGKSWASAGEYIVRCVVSDKKGGEASASQLVVIGSPTTYRISGQVTTAAGPLDGARVYVSSTRMAYTDSDGTYTVVGLPAGSYTVAASLYEYGFANSGFANPVTVGPNAAGADFFATYQVNSPPNITTQPASQAVNAGANVTFNVAATGTQPMSYQWRFNGANIAGATGASYTKNNVQSPDAGNYSVVINNSAGSATSANAALSLATPPSITTQPASQTVIAGNPATFTVVAGGSAPLTYQWRCNGTNLPGATSTSFTRAGTQLADAGNYLVVVANGAGSVTSSVAVLTVNFTLQATATAGGSVGKNPDQVSYAPNTVVTLTAAPTAPYLFAGWSGGASGMSNPLNLPMTANLSVTANFTSPVPDLIIDNPAATFTGTWTLGSAGDQYNTNHALIATSASSPTGTATFTPNIITAANYDVYVWFPTINKGLANAQFILTDATGSITNYLNESAGSGGWVLLSADRTFASGTGGNVRLTNLGQNGKNVAADAVRWSYSANQPAAPMRAGISAAGGMVTISWNSIAGKTYAVQYKTALTDSNWVSLAPNVVASGSTASKTDPVSGSKRFYQVLQY